MLTYLEGEIYCHTITVRHFDIPLSIMDKNNQTVDQQANRGPNKATHQLNLTTYAEQSIQQQWNTHPPI